MTAYKKQLIQMHELPVDPGRDSNPRPTDS